MKRLTFVCSYLEASGAIILSEPHNEAAVVEQVFSAVAASEVVNGLHIELPSGFSDALVQRVLSAFQSAYQKNDIKVDIVVTAGDSAAWSSNEAQVFYKAWLERGALLTQW